MWEIALLIVTALVVWVVFDALRAREAAIRTGKATCGQQGLQFLDDTVRGVRTRWARDSEGHVRWRRTFVFEFSEDGVNRRGGSITMLGDEVDSFELEPYRLV
ncbi:MAG: DUF3301 domain-containing protein [Pseudomonadota bacterium]|nr:DUF3301 domain-containing protein [Pseudomonadota bacterium]